jgi:hypothetical protein
MPIKKAGILRRVEGLREAEQTEFVERVDIIINEGNELVPLPEGNQYPGYIFAQADTTSQVVSALNSAFDKLNFIVACRLIKRAKSKYFNNRFTPFFI